MKKKIFIEKTISRCGDCPHCNFAPADESDGPIESCCNTNRSDSVVDVKTIPAWCRLESA